MRAALVVLLALGACATPAPRVEYREVNIPVRAPCLTPERLPEPRAYADQELQQGAGLLDRVRAMAEGLAQRDEDLPLLWAAVEGCRAPAQ